MKFLLRFLIILPTFVFSHEYLLSLGELGSVRYTYDNEHLLQVERLSPAEEVMYTHIYRYGSEGNLISEKFIGDLGEISYEAGVVRSPYSLETFICNEEEGTLVEHRIDGVLSNLTFDEIEMAIEYDADGRVIRQGEKHFKYDDQHRLIEVITPAVTVAYSYGSSGERNSRTVNGETESYLYMGANEIAILDKNGQIKELRIPGLSVNKNIIRPIAIETRDTIYAPIHDIRGNIVKLVNVTTREVVNLSIPDAYGNGLSKVSPVAWIFSGKHYDSDAELVYFGARYYSPGLKQWLTPDPAYQSTHPYEYCLGNPLAYVDSDGRWAITLVNLAWGAGAAISSPVWGPYALAAAGGAALGYVGYKAYELWQEKKPPRFNGKDLGLDPARCPEEGFEWKGTGLPETGRGRWYNPKTGESLHPDVRHPAPKGPHWGYKDPDKTEYDLYPNGTWL